MTLLIGTASNKHVFLTSDRRCTVKEDDSVSWCDTFQKIFTIPDRPLALVHHGENVFLNEVGNDVPLNQFVPGFIRDYPDVFEHHSIESITAKLAVKLEPTVQRTLANRGEKLIGFWVAGFARVPAIPQIWEVCWFKDGRREFKSGGNLFVGGDGGEHLPPSVRERLDDTHNLDNIPNSAVKTVRQYHDKLFDIALQAEPEPRRFSEERDQLVIECWRWVIPPVERNESVCQEDSHPQ